MKLVILDRDGVINYDSDQYIKSPNEWKPLPGSLEAIAKLTQSGYKVVVATKEAMEALKKRGAVEIPGPDMAAQTPTAPPPAPASQDVVPPPPPAAAPKS